MAINNEKEYDSLCDTITTKMECMLGFIVKNSGVTKNKESGTGQLEQPKHPFYETMLGDMTTDKWSVFCSQIKEKIT